MNVDRPGLARQRVCGCTIPDVDALDRIAIDPAVMLGQPVIKGTRVPVYAIVEAIAAGDSTNDVLEAFPFLTPDDIEQALRFAARLSQWGLEDAE